MQHYIDLAHFKYKHYGFSFCLYLNSKLIHLYTPWQVLSTFYAFHFNNHSYNTTQNLKKLKNFKTLVSVLKDNGIMIIKMIYFFEFFSLMFSVLKYLEISMFILIIVLNILILGSSIVCCDERRFCIFMQTKKMHKLM